ncbi:glucose-6-phosphate dehydrogenase [Methylophilus sp. VKM B-3414]|jgi:glucose-6-phosphate 1-dehydrogenase|uniref:glucose-6-phosphate dehydrogenase n=1 Tax=unclassified Methylophilus TaxID=2630143 RepID=UPI001890AAD3|nr:MULTISPECIES: glucose-6-phosphate dehydrogenase [unclassified Methylophilus]MBF5038987.1 glucose-6-phosphate dehydrogenase [Methylophilus sp. 13]MDT7850214.1 glucose-6-phosphate dehydrogenase [Methylophilus sp. VKM B-3414]
MTNKIDPCTLVLFGASGNLARVKLYPGLFRLDLLGRLPDDMKIIGVGRQVVDLDAWRADIKSMLDTKFKKGYDQKVFERFIARNFYHANPPTDPDAFNKLKATLSDEKVFPQNLAYFLSVRPVDFAPVVESLANVGLTQEDKYWRRVVIEKPFGTDLPSAKELQAAITKHLKESQIYRIDHYLGKSALQNILLQRFTNTVLEPIWNNQYIDHVQITNTEMLGVGDRTQFYDSTGALRDMLQSHILQTLALTAMELPKDLSPEGVRDAKIKLLEQIRPIPVNELEKHAFRAQYSAGEINGEKVPGYLEELGNNDSVVETYAALKLFIDNPRWKGVPFYIRTAKRLHEADTRIAIRFKKAPLQINDQDQNWLIIGIQPRECIKLEIQSKIPGLDVQTRTIQLDAANRWDADDSVDAYEALLLNLMQGDNSNYLHISEAEAQWRLVDPVVKAWAEDKRPVHQYPAGSRDPIESKVIFEAEDQFWRYSIELGGDK